MRIFDNHRAAMVEGTVREVNRELSSVREELVELVTSRIDASGNGHGIARLQRTDGFLRKWIFQLFHYF